METLTQTEEINVAWITDILVPLSLNKPHLNPSIIQASQLWVLFSVSVIFGDVSVVLDPRPVFMLKTFMADLAEPLKHDCNISLPQSPFYQDVPTAYVSAACVCVYVCSCICVERVVSLGPAANAEHDHIALSLSLYYSVQMSDGACVHTAWKTHFQRRKSLLLSWVIYQRPATYLLLNTSLFALSCPVPEDRCLDDFSLQTLSEDPPQRAVGKRPSTQLVSSLILTVLARVKSRDSWASGSHRPPARPMWVDASCIIDKVCLGKLEWVFAVGVLQRGRRQAHKLKAKASHVVCAVFVMVQTQADSVILWSSGARVCIMWTVLRTSLASLHQPPGPDTKWSTPFMLRPWEPRYLWQPLSHTSWDCRFPPLLLWLYIDPLLWYQMSLSCTSVMKRPKWAT